MYPTRSLIPVLVLPFILSLASTTTGQTLSADEKELATYTLTMPTVRKMMEASRLMAEEEAKDPKVQERNKLKARIDALEAKDELTDAESSELDKLRERLDALDEAADNDPASGRDNPKTLAEMEAQIKAHPGAARALAAAGLTPREFARCTMALLQAALVEGFSQGKAELDKLPAGVNPANVKFIREHKAELEAMQKALEKRK